MIWHRCQFIWDLCQEIWTISKRRSKIDVSKDVFMTFFSNLGTLINDTTACISANSVPNDSNVVQEKKKQKKLKKNFSGFFFRATASAWQTLNTLRYECLQLSQSCNIINWRFGRSKKAAENQLMWPKMKTRKFGGIFFFDSDVTNHAKWSATHC